MYRNELILAIASIKKALREVLLLQEKNRISSQCSAVQLGSHTNCVHTLYTLFRTSFLFHDHALSFSDVDPKAKAAHIIKPLPSQNSFA